MAKNPHSVSQAHPIIPANVSRIRLISASQAADECKPLRIAAELDGFLSAAGQRLGEEGIRQAWRAKEREGRLTLPGVGREHQAGLDEIARQLPRALDGRTLSQAWEWRVEREAKEVAQWQARQEDRERRGLARESEQDRERQREGRGLGLGR